MSGIFVRGTGAVSPAGWGVPALLGALQANTPLAPQEVASPSGRRFPARWVPPPPARPAWLAHPRLRRASGITHFALAAALEALQPWPEFNPASGRLGIVTGTHTASVRYSSRFYGEVLDQPGTASPLLFPETVVNAPASHLAAFLGCGGLSYSMLADQTAFVQALRVGCDWLADGRVDACLVIGMDEIAWPVAEALSHHSRRLPLGEGAGAVVLARDPGPGVPVELERVTDARLHTRAATRRPAAEAMRAQLPAEGPTELLVDSCCGIGRLDQAERAAWADWQGARCSPRAVLGEALSAATAWQFVAAQAAVAGGAAAAAHVSVVGSYLEAAGARLVRGELRRRTHPG